MLKLEEASTKELMDARDCAFIFLSVVFDELRKEGQDPRLVTYQLWAHLTYLLAGFGMTVEQLTDDVAFYVRNHKRNKRNQDAEA